MKTKISLLIFISVSSILLGQEYEAGIFIGGSNYVGDIGRTNYIYPNTIAGAVFFKYNWNPRIAVRATYSYLPIKGDDLNADANFRKTRGLDFTNTINELALGIEYNFYEYDISSDDKSWTPYMLIELAAFNYNYANRQTLPGPYELGTKTSFAIPFGIGLKSKLIGPIAFALETKFRYTFDDDLDYTTNTIPSLDFGGNNSDWYMFTGVSLIYTFGRPPCYTKGL
jgi:hypothetical protein